MLRTGWCSLNYKYRYDDTVFRNGVGKCLQCYTKENKILGLIYMEFLRHSDTSKSKIRIGNHTPNVYKTRDRTVYIYNGKMPLRFMKFAKFTPVLLISRGPPDDKTPVRFAGKPHQQWGTSRHSTIVPTLKKT